MQASERLLPAFFHIHKYDGDWIMPVALRCEYYCNKTITVFTEMAFNQIIMGQSKKHAGVVLPYCNTNVNIRLPLANFLNKRSVCGTEIYDI